MMAHMEAADLIRFVVLYRRAGATIWSCTLSATDAEDAGLLAWGEYADVHHGGDIFAKLPDDVQVQVARIDS
jgi:hypothetical protein